MADSTQADELEVLDAAQVRKRGKALGVFRTLFL
jgi:hypothetical protein